ncbi:MAG: WYL domain-containing transcriptional regulator, partial [Clostridia bacterium]|nr:WYL domain-containing transcriptional regulator [Clostridia bacterium]
TIRKKLKEYVEEGIAKVRKEGRKVYYRRSDTVDISSLTDMLHFFSETAPCGVIGSFLLDKTECDTDTFTFKHHYITGALDSGVLTSLFVAMREGRVISAANSGRKSKNEPRRIRLVPLRIFISVQSGRQYLAAYQPEYNSMKTFRLDYLSLVKLEEETPRFAELRAMLDDMQKHMWGVSIGGFKPESRRLEHVEFTVRVERGEDYIIKRLEREKRCGTVEALGGGLYRFTADVFDSTEMLPWIRTFICRIVSMNFSNRTVENRFKADLEKMYEMYGIGEGE